LKEAIKQLREIEMGKNGDGQ